MQKNISIYITGKVYKTGYRFFVKQMAGVLHISGMVCYLNDHVVLIHAYGKSSQLERFIDFCRIGNLDSKIETLKIEILNSKPTPSFEILNETINFQHKK